MPELGAYDYYALAVLALFIGYQIPLVQRLYFQFKYIPNYVIAPMAFLYSWIQVIGTPFANPDTSLILMRTVDTSTLHGGHYLVFVILLSFATFTYLHPKPSFFRAAILTAGIIGLHVCLWNVFYLFMPNVLTAELNADLFFAESTLTVVIMFSTGAFFYRSYMKSVFKLLPYWLGFMGLWVIEGFQITLDVRYGGPSPFVHDPAVNMIEIISWYIFTLLPLLRYVQIYPLKSNVLYAYYKSIRVRVHHA